MAAPIAKPNIPWIDPDLKSIKIFKSKPAKNTAFKFIFLELKTENRIAILNLLILEILLITLIPA